MKQYKVTGEGLHYCDKESTPVPVGAIVLEDVLDMHPIEEKRICKFGNCPDRKTKVNGDLCKKNCLLPSGLLQEGYYNWFGEELPIVAVKHNWLSEPVEIPKQLLQKNTKKLHEAIYNFDEQGYILAVRC